MRYKELDALRGIAALLVVFFHFTMCREEGMLGFRLGTTGVDLFFMISGFVILLSLQHVNSLHEFVINRISRLYPTYWVCVTFGFILMIIQSLYSSDWSNIDIVKYLANMTMFQFYMRIGNLDGPYWTMIIEMIFYIVMGLLFYLKFLKYLIQIGVALISLVVLGFILDFDNIWLIRIIWWIPLLQFIPLFLAGTVFYRIATTEEKYLKNYIVLIFCLLSQIFLFEYVGRSRSFISQGEYALMLTSYFILFTLFVNMKLKFIVSRVTLFLGEISFVLYLIHQKISLDYILPLLIDELHVNFWIASMVTFCIVIILATLITYYIGLPYSKKMKEKLFLKFNKVHQTIR